MPSVRPVKGDIRSTSHVLLSPRRPARLHYHRDHVLAAQEDNLQHLALFSEYGRIALTGEGLPPEDDILVHEDAKPFQRIEFLVRTVTPLAAKIVVCGTETFGLLNVVEFLVRMAWSRPLACAASQCPPSSQLVTTIPPAITNAACMASITRGIYEPPQLRTPATRALPLIQFAPPNHRSSGAGLVELRGRGRWAVEAAVGDGRLPAAGHQPGRLRRPQAHARADTELLREGQSDHANMPSGTGGQAAARPPSIAFTP
jgi:hypothetical protein